MIWHLLAKLCAIPRVATWLIARAQRTPYTPIMSQDGSVLYMGRWWLLNRYDKPGFLTWLPSIRIHHILVPDQDPHLHDHPWNARTIILRGAYREQLPELDYGQTLMDGYVYSEIREEGYTGRLLFGQFHRIAAVSDGGVWTLFFTWKYRGTWGFLVDGVKVPWREYLGVPEQ